MAGGWFATDDDDEVDEAQQAVLDVLRARASSDHWPMIDPAHTNVALPDYDTYGYPLQPGETSFGKVLAWLDVPDPEERSVLLTVGSTSPTRTCVAMSFITRCSRCRPSRPISR